MLMPARRARLALAALLAAAVTAGFEAGAIGFVLPALRQATGASASEASWLLSAWVAATLLSVPACALASRRQGSVRLLRGCLLVAVVAGLLACTLPLLAGVLVAGVLQGLAYGPLLPLVAAVAVSGWPPERHGRVLGLVSLAYGLSFVAATLGAPALLSGGWRHAFAFGTGLALLSLLLAVGLASDAADRGQPAGQAAGQAVDWRQAVSRPLQPVVVLSLGTGIGQAALVWLPTLALALLGVPLADLAPLMVPMLLGGLAATASVIHWLDRIGPRRLVAVGQALALAGLLLAVLAPARAWAFMAGSAALGYGIGLLSGGPLRYAAARVLPREAQGLAQGAVAWITDLGLLAGSLVLGHVAGPAGPAEPGSTAGAGIEQALLVAAAALLLCAPALLRLPAHTPPPATRQA